MFVLKVMDFVLTMMGFVLKMMDFVLKLMGFARKNDGFYAKIDGYRQNAQARATFTTAAMASSAPRPSGYPLPPAQ